MENNIKLTIKISHKDAIDLYDLTRGLNSLAKIYSRFNNNAKEAKLLVREIKKSSIEIDLITLMCASPIPILSNVNNIIQFCKYIKFLIATFSEHQKEEAGSSGEDYLPTPSIHDYKDFREVTQIISNAQDSINFAAKEITNHGPIYMNGHFNGNEAREIKNNIEKILNEKEAFIKEKQLFYWVQTNFTQTNTGNKGIIENIFKEPLRVIFNDTFTKNEMTISNNRTEWQKKFYIIDVEIQYADQKPKIYKILKNYAEESFPMEEDNTIDISPVSAL